MAAALGTLPDAPLIYVLAQVVFTRVPKMASFWEDFHHSVFEHYPGSLVEEIQRIQFGGSPDGSTSNVTRWHMLNRDKTEGIILGADSIVFHATSYESSLVFFQKLERVLKALKNILPVNVSVSRLGLRYIDLILPTSSLSADNQVSGKLGSIPLDEANCKFEKLEEVTTYSTSEGGSLVVRHRQSLKQDILPADLFPNNLRLAHRLERPVSTDDTATGLLDYDHYVPMEIEFMPDAIIEKFRSIHKTNSHAFALTTTPEAKELWKGEYKNE